MICHRSILLMLAVAVTPLLAQAVELELVKAEGSLYETRTHFTTSGLMHVAMSLPDNQQILVVKATYDVSWSVGEDSFKVLSDELQLELADGTRSGQIGWGVPASKFHTSGSYMVVSVSRNHQHRDQESTSQHVLHVGFAVPGGQNRFKLHVGDRSIDVKAALATEPELASTVRFLPIRAFYLPPPHMYPGSQPLLGKVRVPEYHVPTAGHLLRVEVSVVVLEQNDGYTDRPRASVNDDDISMVIDGMACPLISGAFGGKDMEEGHFPTLHGRFTITAPANAKSVDIYYWGTKVCTVEIAEPRID